MDTLPKIVARIERRLKATGQTATAASVAAGLSKSAIYNLQRGAKGKINIKSPNSTTISKLARALDTTTGWLLEGAGDESDTEAHFEGPVPLVGYVGAGATAHFVPSGQLGGVDRPEWATDRTVAVEIRGDSLGPLFDRWIVYYDDVRRPVTADLIGKLCVVGLADGRVLIKKIAKGRGSKFDLLSTDEPIRGVEIEWAGRVKQMVPK